MRNVLLVLLILTLPSLALLFFSTVSTPRSEPAVARIQSPAADGSGQPNLHASDGGDVYLSWIEPDGTGGHRLRFSRWTDRGWEAPRTIASGDGWFVNWADFPALAVVDDRFMAAHHLALSGPRSYDYDIRLSISRDRGRTWGPPLTPHRDGVPAEHGFVSMLPWNGRLGIVWLDGRNSGDETGFGGAMTLRFATVSAAGKIADEAELDGRVCDCCQTSAARTEAGLIVAYRDRSPDEIRDIAVVRLADGRWSAPEIVYRDGWRIPGCPVNGPSVTADGNSVALAWYTGQEGRPRVQLAFSSNSGKDFGEPIQLAGAEAMGRVHTAMLSDRSVAVSWMEFVDEESVEIRLLRVHPDGRRSEVLAVGAIDAARSSGFPRMARSGDSLIVAWTQLQPTKEIALSRIFFDRALPLTGYSGRSR